MRRAGDARVIVSDCLFALPGKLFVRQTESCGDKLTQVAFDCSLVLRGWGYNSYLLNYAVRVNAVPVIQDSARCFGATVPDTGARRHFNKRFVRRFVF